MKSERHMGIDLKGKFVEYVNALVQKSIFFYFYDPINFHRVGFFVCFVLFFQFPGNL